MRPYLVSEPYRAVARKLVNRAMPLAWECRLMRRNMSPRVPAVTRHKVPQHSKTVTNLVCNT